MYPLFIVQLFDIKSWNREKAKGKQLESGDYLIFDKLVLCAANEKDTTDITIKIVILIERMFILWK